MIEHIVLLKLKPETSDKQVREAFEAAEQLPNEIPGRMSSPGVPVKTLGIATSRCDGPVISLKIAPRL